MLGSNLVRALLKAGLDMRAVSDAVAGCEVDRLKGVQIYHKE